MSFKSKTVGIIAGTAIALSIASGALADGDTTAILKSNNAGDCFASAASGNIALGVWNWTGTDYAFEAGSNSGSINFNITQTVRPTPTVDCVIGVTVSNLTRVGGSVSEFIPFGTSNLSVASGSSTGSTPYTVVTDADGANLVLNAALTSVPSNLPQGTYTSTVTVTSTTASN